MVWASRRGGEAFKSPCGPLLMRKILSNNTLSSASDNLFGNYVRHAGRPSSPCRAGRGDHSQVHCSSQWAKRIKLGRPSKLLVPKQQLLSVYDNCKIYLPKSHKCVAMNIPVAPSVYYLCGLCPCGLWRFSLVLPTVTKSSYFKNAFLLPCFKIFPFTFYQ